MCIYTYIYIYTYIHIASYSVLYIVNHLVLDSDLVIYVGMNVDPDGEPRQRARRFSWMSEWRIEPPVGDLSRIGGESGASKLVHMKGVP